MRKMNNITKFRQLVVGEKFRLPGSHMLMIKEILRQEPGLGWINASYDNTVYEQLCFFYDDTQVVRKQSNEVPELRRSTKKQNSER
jgi:hypothetical protein